MSSCDYEYPDPKWDLGVPGPKQNSFPYIFFSKDCLVIDLNGNAYFKTK